VFGIGRLDEGLCGTPRAQPAEFLLLEGAVEEAWIALAKDLIDSGQCDDTVMSPHVV